jgi:cell division protease FtsH
MLLPLHNYTAAHRWLLEAASRATSMCDPVALSAGQYHGTLLKAARKGAALPVDGVLVHDWGWGQRKGDSGIRLGMRVYDLDGISFVAVQFAMDMNAEESGLSFLAVERKDYRRLYRLARRALRESEPAGTAPVLTPALADVLWNNTIAYLESERLRQIRAYGGRARRGVLLTGPPGNGKTMACRWIWEECRRRNWEYRIVTPAAYQHARRRCDSEKAIRNLFSARRRGIIFFDDMDIALRDRDKVNETDDQATFLTAIDGIHINEGVVHVFTTNCPLDLVDRAFKRPGRIDLVLNFQAPDARLRRQFLERWHSDLMTGMHLDDAVAATAGFSFAEIDELRNLLLMRFVDTGAWNWAEALEQFGHNRADLQTQIRRAPGFALPKPHGNGRKD